jgi:hypothetical protein
MNTSKSSGCVIVFPELVQGHVTPKTQATAKKFQKSEFASDSKFFIPHSTTSAILATRRHLPGNSRSLQRLANDVLNETESPTLTDLPPWNTTRRSALNTG